MTEWNDLCAIKSSTGVWHVLSDPETDVFTWCGKAIDGEDMEPMGEHWPQCNRCRVSYDKQRKVEDLRG